MVGIIFEEEPLPFSYMGALLEEAQEIDTETENGLFKDQKMMYTLQTLDKSIHYLAWQMKHINGSIPHSASSSSAESTTSIQSWTRTSTRDTPFSQSETPPSPAPASQKGDYQKWHLSLVRSPGAGFQQSHQESIAHHKVDFSMCQKQLQEKGRGPAPQPQPLVRLIPTSLSLGPANKGTSAHKQSNTKRLHFMDYKEQELLDWHIQRKHQSKEVAPLPLASGVITGREIRALTGTVGPPLGGNFPRGGQQPPLCLMSRSHTPPQVIIQGCHTPPKPLTPPKPHAVRSPGPIAWPPLPAPEDLMPPPMLVCKTESRSSIRSLTESKMAGGVPKEDLTKLLSLLGPSKSPILRETGRPGTPKEKEKDGHNSSRRPNTPKEGHCSVERANSPKVKQEDVENSTMMDRKMRKLCWADVKPEAQKAVRVWEQPAASCPKFLDPLFMCQNQLEMPCIAAARVELQHQENQPFANPLCRGTFKPQCLAHTIVESLDMKQAMQDLHVSLAKGLEKGYRQPSVEYPICLLCGCCTPYCPHPRPQHSPCLLVYPRLCVQDGEVHMTLGFLLKIRRSEADEWGLVQGADTSKAQWGKERRRSKKERSRSRSRSRSRQRRGHGRAGRHHSRGPDKARQHALEGADLRSRGTVQKGFESTAAPTPPQPYKRHRHRPHRKQAPLAVEEEEELTPKRHPSILKHLLLCIKKVWARMRGRRDKTPLKRGSVTFSSKPWNRPPSPEVEEEEVLSVVPAAPEGPKRGGILLNRKDSLLVLTPENSRKQRTPNVQHETAHSKKGSRRSRSRRRAAHRFTEPEPSKKFKK
ncbi:uncharacterized protein [Tiliqua scincoides]|uniref:uncharacterized protein isoform X2 n=1 Tax=Tiliqua scincoides TaxID=71010 RepID=UPI003462231D